MLHGLPSPLPDFDTETFWSGCDAGELLLQKCQQCETFRWPPGPSCPHCGSAESLWIPSEGTGRVYSWVVVRVPLLPSLSDQLPYAVGLVELSEGVRIVSTISNCDVDQIVAGMDVSCVFGESTGAQRIFTFVPISTDAPPSKEMTR